MSNKWFLSGLRYNNENFRTKTKGLELEYSLVGLLTEHLKCKAMLGKE